MENLKDHIKSYWTKRAPSFVEQRLREFESEKRGLWLKEIARYLPKKNTLRILDVGTGTGFLACLLAAEGHTVMGIDLTSEMISRAKAFAKAVKAPAKFLVMDAECPDFPPDRHFIRHDPGRVLDDFFDVAAKPPAQHIDIHKIPDVFAAAAFSQIFEQCAFVSPFFPDRMVDRGELRTERRILRIDRPQSQLRILQRSSELPPCRHR